MVPLIPSSQSLLSNAYNLESHHHPHLISPLYVGEFCSHTIRLWKQAMTVIAMLPT